MENVNLLKLADGQLMPQEGFGLYKITDQSTITSSIRNAYNAGYRLFDTAQLYKNEAEVGAALQELSLPRKKLFITTKVAEPIRVLKEPSSQLRILFINWSWIM